jgi:hypothetical protein
MGNIGEVGEIESFSSFGSSSSSTTMPLLSLNHVSYVCKSVSRSVRFYEEVLGFVMIKRPSSFNFEGAWYALPSLFISHLLFSFFCSVFLSLFTFLFFVLIAFSKNFCVCLFYACNQGARSTCWLSCDAPPCCGWLITQPHFRLYGHKL